MLKIDHPLWGGGGVGKQDGASFILIFIVINNKNKNKGGALHL